MSSAAIERRCPSCGAESYGGGDRPREIDGLVYRRRRCLSKACGKRFVVVEGIATDNELLMKLLVAYHESTKAGLRYLEGLDLPGRA